MFGVKFCAILIIISLFRDGLAQKKAKQKCVEFVPKKVNSALNVHHIIGGTKTLADEFPHMAALGFGSLTSPVYLCGGTLISDQFVLTAAHCTNLRNVGSVKMVRLGTRSLKVNTGNFLDVSISQIINHPQYKSPNTYNDLALLKLQRKITFSNNILPACLHTTSKLNGGSNSLTALGWGNTDFVGMTSDDLLKVELKLFNYNDCNRGYRGASKEKLPNGVRNAVQVCAGGESGKDTCQGDSGGPLEYKSGRFHYIVGITSFGKACGIGKTPGIYTRVSAYVPWIESVVWS